MTDRNQRELDELSDLIDSIENDDTMKRKMDAFSQRKQRKRRLQKLENDQHTTQIPTLNQEPIEQTVQQPITSAPSSDAGQTVVIPTPASSAPQTDASKTTVFKPGAVSADQQGVNNQTVVINDKKIQSIIDQTSTPTNSRPIPQKKERSTMPIVVALLAIFATLMLGFGVYTMVTGNKDIPLALRRRTLRIKYKKTI